MEEFQVEESNIKYLKSEPIRKAILHLSVPMMIGISAGTLYNLINAYFIGLVHDTGMMSAITLGLPIFTVLMAVGNVFGVGGGTFITRLIGENNSTGARKVAGYSFYSSIIVAVLLGILATLFIQPLLQLLGGGSSIHHYLSQYTLVLFIGGFAIIGNFTLEQLVRSEGASKESMYGMFLSVVVSILLDILLILGFNWHVFGAALSMVLANAASALYYLYFLETKSERLKGFLREFSLPIKEQIEIYKIGLSELLKMSFLIVTTLLLNNYAMNYGDSVVASFGIALRITQLPEFITMGLFMGIIPLIAYNFASKNKERLLASIKEVSLWILLISVIFAAVAFLFRKEILLMFTNDSDVLRIGVVIMAAQLLSSVFNGLTGLFTGIYQASGEGVATMVMSVAQGVLVIPLIIVLHAYFGLDGLIWAMTVTEGITLLLGLLLFIPYMKKVNQLDAI